MYNAAYFVEHSSDSTSKINEGRGQTESEMLSSRLIYSSDFGPDG